MAVVIHKCMVGYAKPFIFEALMLLERCSITSLPLHRMSDLRVFKKNAVKHNWQNESFSILISIHPFKRQLLLWFQNCIKTAF